MNLIDYLSKLDDLIEVESDISEDIAIAEDKLNCHFSEEYKSVLLKYGQVSVGSHDIMGLRCVSSLDVVKQTLYYREHEYFKTDEYYVIEDLGIDKIVLAQNSDGVVFATQPNSDPVRVADSLLDYFKKLL